MEDEPGTDGRDGRGHQGRWHVRRADVGGGLAEALDPGGLGAWDFCIAKHSLF